MTPRLDNCEDLHPDWKNWHWYLTNRCKLIGLENGYAHFNFSNEHHIVTPENTVISTHGFNGYVIMDNLTGHEPGYWKTLETE